MLAETLEKQYTLMTKITSYTFGHAFVWDKDKKELGVNPSKSFQVVRWILTVWSVWSSLHEIGCMLYGMKYADQKKIDDLVDMLYAGGSIVCVFLHVAYLFLENKIVRFVNQMAKLNSKFEGFYTPNCKLNKHRKKFFF